MRLPAGRIRSLMVVAVGFAATGCSSPPQSSSGAEPAPVAQRPVVAATGILERDEERALDRDRIRTLEQEVERLRFDLSQAEATLRESETKSKLLRTRATAVSVLAEAWISVEQAEAVAQW